MHPTWDWSSGSSYKGSPSCRFPRSRMILFCGICWDAAIHGRYHMLVFTKQNSNSARTCEAFRGHGVTLLPYGPKYPIVKFLGFGALWSPTLHLRGPSTPKLGARDFGIVIVVEQALGKQMIWGVIGLQWHRSRRIISVLHCSTTWATRIQKPPCQHIHLARN